MKVGAAFKKGKKTTYYITVPKKCPAGGFPVKSVLTLPRRRDRGSLVQGSVPQEVAADGGEFELLRERELGRSAKRDGGAIDTMAPPSCQLNRKEVIGLRMQTAGWRRGAAGFAGVLCVAALVAVVLLATSAGGSNGGYTVRAIFDDAGNVISGENVKIDGVTVGSVGSVTPTPQAQAAVVLKIENPGFQNFRADASCTIEPEALLGEKFVNCLPTQPRAAGTPLPPPLKKIPNGQEGAGEYLLPVQNTSSPVDVDLLNGHHAPARGRTLHDHHQRARRRARRRGGAT